LEPGDEATIRRVPDGDGELLRYLSSLLLVPGNRVKVWASAPLGGPLTVSVDDERHAISREVAELIGVA
jgi:DtxR family Mn-dependent transcriptional regulator